MAHTSDLERTSTLSLSLESDLLFQRHSIPSPELLVSPSPIHSKPTQGVHTCKFQSASKPVTRKLGRGSKSGTYTVVGKAHRKGVKRSAFPIVCGYLGLTQSMTELKENGSRKKEGDSALWAAKEPTALINYLQGQRKKSRQGREPLSLGTKARLQLAKPRMLPPLLGLSYSRLLEHSATTVL